MCTTVITMGRANLNYPFFLLITTFILRTSASSLDSQAVFDAFLKMDRSINLTNETDRLRYLSIKYRDFNEDYMKAANNNTISLSDMKDYLDPQSFFILRVYTNYVDISYEAFCESIKSNHELSQLRDKIQNPNIYYQLRYSILLSTARSYKHKWCKSDPKETVLNHVQNLYNFVSLREFKIYLVTRFYELLTTKDLRAIGGTALPKRTDEAFKGALKYIKIKEVVRKCDPERFVQGENYLQFTKLLQGFIPNIDGQHSLSNYFHRCTGTKVMNCMEINQAGTACLSSFSYRRLDYVKKGNDLLLGKRQYCNKENLKQINAPFRICLCDEQSSKSDRYVSLHAVKSNVENNRVITGIKFTKIQRVVHLQIQEGKLLPKGAIDQSTVEWVPIQKYNITDSTYAERDFFLMTNQSRTVAVDRLHTEEDDYVLTGVRFKLVNGIIYMEITVTQFDEKSGKLHLDRTETIDRTEDTERTFFNLDNVDVPVYTDKPSQIIDDTTAEAFINFTNSDFRRDAAQTTVPFLDAQKVTVIPAVPLVGAGLYYKGRKGYGGFLAPLIITHSTLDFL